ncbi:MAG: ATP-binding protein [Chloroherpetonaceae bacterium]
MHRSEFSVLIIDDNSDEITLLERFLSRNLIPIQRIDIARKGREGLEKIRNEHPDFVIVGDACPDMGRSELLKHLSEIASAETLPTLCLVNDEATAASQSLRANQIGVVKKSMLTPEKLRDAMLALIEQAETRVERNRAETLFALLSENSDDAISLIDASGVLVAANKAYLNLFHLHTSSIGKKLETKDYAEIFSKSDHAALSKSFHNDENGNQLELHVKRFFVEERGKRGFMLSIYKVIRSEPAEQTHSDSLEEISANSDETKLLRQLETVQREALQTTLVILRAKSRRFSKGNFSSLLQEHNRRMSLILAACECVSVSGTSLRVGTAQYVESAFRIFQKSPLMQSNVIMKYEGESLSVELNEAIFIGLILGELITNALQHAFTNRGGVLIVSFFKEKDQTIGMVVSDSGVGMPFKIDAKPPESMGLMIVSSLTKKLNGKMEVKRQLGTTVRISFPQKN